MRRRFTYKPRSLRNRERRTALRLITNFVIAIVLVYILINWGLPFLVDGLSVFNRFKPSENKSTTPIEDAAIPPPVLNIPFESTNTATIRIPGYSSPNSKVEIYVDDDLKATVETNSDGGFVAESIELALGTNNIYGQTVNEDNEHSSSSSKKSLASKNIKVYYSSEKPKLEVSEPPDGHEIKGGDKKVRVSGTTDPNNSVSINGATAIVNTEGKFSTEIAINDGDNDISISATNQFGNSSKLSRKVKYTP